MKKGLWTVCLAVVLVSFFMMSVPASWAQGKGPIKIGWISPLSGGMAANGKDMLTGMELYLDEIGYQVAGRKIEFISADTGGNPAGARTKAQELIERDKVNVILGPLAAFELLAITHYVRDNATPLISLAAAEDVTHPPDRRTPGRRAGVLTRT